MPNPSERTGIDGDIDLAWAEIRSLTERLLDCARNGEWEPLGELHARREALIRSFFNAPVARSVVNEVRKGILSVLESDKEVMELVRQQKSDAATMIQGLQSGRKAHKAYSDIGKSGRR